MLLLGLIELPTWLLYLGAAGVSLYIYYVVHYGQWKRQGIKGPTPLPFLGTMMSDFNKGFDKWPELPKKYGKVYGTFMGHMPMLNIADPEMLKQITVKEFHKFQNHTPNGFNEEPLNELLTQIKDDHWKHVRNSITPAFSAGKLKRMISHVNKAAKQFADQVGVLAKSGEEFEMKRLCNNFTMDVIAGTAFGIQIDSQKNPDDPFIKHGNDFFKFKPTNPAFILFFIAPWATPYLRRIGIRLFPKESTDFFTSIMKEAMEQRQEKEGGQLDFLQMMVKAQRESIEDKGEKQQQEDEDSATPTMDGAWNRKGLTQNEIIGQALLFFLAGFDTTGSALSFLCYNLMTNQDVQEKVREEIQEVMGDKETIEYEDVGKLEYLDRCIQESLRRFPPAPFTDRLCQEDAVIGDVHIKKGTTIALPIVTIHHMEEIYPDPFKFDPERFTTEAKAARHPYSWMPFGLGPRNCIGMRLALMEIKIAVATIVRNYKLLPSAKTEVPLKMKKFQMHAVNGIWLKAQAVE